jgi:SPP1 gp7 family putative phage head morphogenesis protein
MASVNAGFSAEFATYSAAVEALRKRVPMSDDAFAAMVGATHQTAFTMAGVQQAKVAEDVWKLILLGIEQGRSVRAIRESIAPVLAAAWGGDNPFRCETIARNAVQSSYNAAKWEEMNDPDSAAFRPYREFVAIVDGDTTKVCREWDGVVLEGDDPRWAGHVPPLHHRCRSTVRALRRREVERKGGPTVSPPASSANAGFGGIPRGGASVDTGADSLSPTVKQLATAKTDAPGAAGLRSGTPTLGPADPPALPGAITELTQPPARPWMPRRALPSPLPPSEVRRIARQRRGERPKKADPAREQTAKERARLERESRRASLENFDELCDAQAKAGARAFSYGYDYTIREYLGGSSYADLVASRVRHLEGKGLTAEAALKSAQEHVPEAIQRAHQLERAFYQAADRQVETTTYRGIGGLSDEVLDRFLAEDVFDMQGKPSSTSAAAGVAQNFMFGGMLMLGADRPGGHGILFVLRRKSKAVAIETVSRVAMEREIIVHGNTQWRIVRRTRYADFAGHQAWVIEAEEIL